MALFKIEAQNIANGSISTDKVDSGFTATYATYAAVAANLTPRIASVNVANSTWHVLDDTAVNTAGGYLVITGANFQSGAIVTIGETPATSTSYVDETTLRVQVPAKDAGSYTVYVQNPDGGTGIKVLSTSFSNTPIWGTSATLDNQSVGTAFAVNISANSDSSVTYSNTSALPAGTTLLSNGYFYGTVTGISEETTYTFSVEAIDAENQETPRTFSVTFSIDSMWIRQIGSNSSGQIIGGALIIDDDLNVYSGMSTFREGAGTTTWSSALVTKFNSSGSLVFKTYQSLSSTAPYIITTGVLDGANVHFGGVVGTSGAAIHGTTYAGGHFTINKTTGSGINYKTYYGYGNSTTYGGNYYSPHFTTAMTVTENTFGGSGNIIIGGTETNWDGNETPYFYLTNSLTQGNVDANYSAYYSPYSLTVQDMVTHPQSNYVYMVSSGKGNYTFGTTTSRGALTISKFNPASYATQLGNYAFEPLDLTSLALDPSTNTVYCIGTTNQNVGTDYPVVIKFTDNLTLAWAKGLLGEASVASGGYFFSQSNQDSFNNANNFAKYVGTRKPKVALDDEGNIYIAYNTSDLSNTGSVKIIKMDSSGTILWSRQLSSSHASVNKVFLTDMKIKGSVLIISCTVTDFTSKSYVLVSKILKSGAGTGTYGDLSYSSYSDPTVTNITSWNTSAGSNSSKSLSGITAAPSFQRTYVGSLNAASNASNETIDVIL